MTVIVTHDLLPLAPFYTLTVTRTFPAPFYALTVTQTFPAPFMANLSPRKQSTFDRSSHCHLHHSMIS